MTNAPPAASSESEPLDLFVTCPAGLSEWLAAELTTAGAQQLQTAQAGVSCQADLITAYKINLTSRIASRVLMRIGGGRYRSDKDVFRRAQAIDWENYLHPAHSLRVDTRVVRTGVKSVNMVTLRVKDAIVDRLREHFDDRPDINTTNPDTRVVVYLQDRDASFYMDLSGESLFKRGWRGSQDKGEAPLKENLAAALVAASAWTPNAPLFDPFCGSGTIVIEAVQAALGIAPGLDRDFALENLTGFDPATWQQARAAVSQTTDARAIPAVFASDIDESIVQIAKANSTRAGIANKSIQFKTSDFLDRPAPTESPGWIVSNLPYGERMRIQGKSGASEPDVLKAIGEHLRKHYRGWTICLLSSDRKLPGKLRLRESRKIPVYNGTLDCRFFIFKMQG